MAYWDKIQKCIALHASQTTQKYTRTKLDTFLQETSADELIVTKNIYDRDAHHSFKLLAEVMGLG